MRDLVTAFHAVRNTIVAGFFFLLPVIVVYILIAKAWTSLGSIGKRLADVFGLPSLIGLHGSTAATGLLLLVLCLGCGLLVRHSLVAAFGRALEGLLSKYVPAYDTYKAMAEAKLQNKVPILPYTSALLERPEGWQPVYIVERDSDDRYVLFVPNAPDTGRGHVLLARGDQVKVLSSITANELDAALKKLGKGLATELRIQPR
ncbi:MAG TPA: hypothetical protein VMH36_16610 [Alphaproteobacteria bacterium]|nr:hypothetical protein [Alphaproteobacteria bacterium]